MSDITAYDSCTSEEISWWPFDGIICLFMNAWDCYNSSQFSKNPSCSDLGNVAVEQQHAAEISASATLWFLGGRTTADSYSLLLLWELIIASQKKLLWCLDYTLDCRSQCWRPVTSTTQKTRHKGNLFFARNKTARGSWWIMIISFYKCTLKCALHLGQHIWKSMILHSTVCQIYFCIKACSL